MLRLLYTNEKYMPRASEFIPERWLDGYTPNGQRLVPEDPSMMQWMKNLPFGGGPRICPGKLVRSCYNAVMSTVHVSIVETLLRDSSGQFHAGRIAYRTAGADWLFVCSWQYWRRLWRLWASSTAWR